MSSLLSAELAATCNALGYFDSKSNKYYADSNTLETAKDLIRYLRRDDETFEIRRFLGETKVVQTDLLPLLKYYWEETDLFDVLLRLLVNLTTPSLMLWQEEIPTEKSIRNHYLQIEEHLQYYKEAFADVSVWAVLSTRLGKILETDFAERGDENSLVIERILILIRNILYVPADVEAEKRPDNDASVHDQVLWALHQSGMLDIILYITSSTSEQAYNMHILEILSFMLREQSASDLAQAAFQRGETEKKRDETALLNIRCVETNKRQEKLKMFTGARHSRFGGTYVVKSMKSISDNELIYHKPLNKLDALNFDADKIKPKTPKNRLPVQEKASDRRSAFTIRLFLKEFCVEFLNGAYNTLMYNVKDSLVRAKAQAHDESYYLWAVRFFMEFNRYHKFEVKLISETMSIQTFHFVQQQMEKYFDMIAVDKKKTRMWSRRLHLSLLAYKELLLTLCSMGKSADTGVQESAKVIKSNLIYVVEYRELILTLLLTFNELKMSCTYLNDLIETQHIFLKMMQSFCGNSGDIIVQKKGKAKRKKKKAASVAAAVPEMNLESYWDEVAPQLSTVLEAEPNTQPDVVVPFDATSDVPIDEQKTEAMKKVQRNLRNGEFEVAVGLLRAAREIWPENDCFGSQNITAAEEFLSLRDIYFADLGENFTQSVVEPDAGEDHWSEENEEDEDEGANMTETSLQFDDFVKRLANPKIIRVCGLALTNFESNSFNVNHCIVKLLHRVAFDCKLYCMVFQISIFRTFQKIYAARTAPQFKELQKFATYVIRQFFKLAKNNEKLFTEVLFWKSVAEANEIESGYSNTDKSMGSKCNVWTESEESELKMLFMEHREKQIKDDVVDWIVYNRIDNNKTHRAILKKLKEMCLLTNYKGPRKSGISAKIPLQWGEDEVQQLRELYERFKDTADPLSSIMDRLDVSRPRVRIVEKLIELGLARNKIHLRKKVLRKQRSVEKPRGEFFDDDPRDVYSSMSSDTEDEDEDNTRTKNHPPARKNKKSYSKKKAKNIKKYQTPSTQLIPLLIKMVESGLVEALEWLCESFTDAAEDIDDNDDCEDTGIPLVPILDFALLAMENSNFQTLIKLFGLKKPTNEQEMYWRIPTNITADTLKGHCSVINDALKKKLMIPETSADIAASDADNQEDSSDEDVFGKIQQIMNEPNESESSDQEYNNKIKRKPGKRVDTNKNSVTHNENEDKSLKESVGQSKTHKRKKIIIEDSSDSDLPEEEAILDSNVAEINTINVDNRKQLHSLSDSDSEHHKNKRARKMISDDED